MPHHGFAVEIAEGVPVVAAPEEIDITNAAALRSALFDAAAGHHATLVVDMTRTQFCDVSGLHAVVAAHKQAEAEGRKVVLVVTGTPVLRVLALTGIDRVIHNVSSLAAALAYAHRRDDHAALSSDPMTESGSELDHAGQRGAGQPVV
jgi:anti-sigma B factor antagonist